MPKQIALQSPMAIPQISVVQTKLLDRYVLPKVAMVLILVSSAAGAWLTLRGAGDARADLVLAKWAYFVSLSIVLGGGLWGAYFAKSSYEEQDIDAPSGFLRLEYDGFATIQRYAMLAMLGAGAYVLVGYSVLFGTTFAPWYNGIAGIQGILWLLLAGAVAATLTDLGKAGPSWLSKRQQWLKLTVLLSLLTLIATAALDVIPYHGASGPAILARWVHLSAFGVWFGGAVWNVFVAVPAARKTLNFETVFAAAAQLDQFRRVVRFALPLVLVTGLFQAYGLIGLNFSALTVLPVGPLLLAKVGLIISLVAIFLACPMWRACSPISGVCDITDLDPTPSSPKPNGHAGGLIRHHT